MKVSASVNACGLGGYIRVSCGPCLCVGVRMATETHRMNAHAPGTAHTPTYIRNNWRVHRDSTSNEKSDPHGVDSDGGGGAGVVGTTQKHRAEGWKTFILTSANVAYHSHIPLISASDRNQSTACSNSGGGQVATQAVTRCGGVT